MRYKHATVRWYMLSYDKVVPKFFIVLYMYVWHKLDVRYM